MRLKDVAKVVKSKNAGPFEITLDIILPDAQAFDLVEASGVFDSALFARLYGFDESEILFSAYRPALAFKATIPRRIASGDIGDTDVYGAQQHAPLLDVEIPWSGSKT
ncbi:DUF4387 domain-containing protein [Pigmentiphaga soli]|uniref:DUF4387 domain-containing protein n=1 Tax=Pigmentiphaga soli TaxID=1007095 RepID=A0ABP8HIC6_9BURK